MDNKIENSSLDPEQGLHVPECKGLSDTMIIRMIRSEIKSFVEIFDKLTDTLKKEYRGSFDMLYENLWMSEIVYSTNVPGIGEKQLISLIDTAKTRLFRIGRSLDTEYFVKNLLKESDFARNIQKCYMAEDNNNCAFWEWIFILNQYSVKQDLANILYECYKRTRRYYLLYLYRISKNIHYIEKAEQMLEQENKIISILQNPKRGFYEIETDLSNFIQCAPGVKISELLKPLKFRYTDTHNKYGIDKTKFNECIKTKTSESYNEAICILLKCDLPQELQEEFLYIQDRLKLLYEMIEKYDAVYVVDLHTLFETYLPECLRLSLCYLEYLEADPLGKEIKNIQNSVLEAIKELHQAMDQEISCIIKFTSLDEVASAKALETLLIRDGYVDDQYLIRKRP